MANIDIINTPLEMPLIGKGDQSLVFRYNATTALIVTTEKVYQCIKSLANARIRNSALAIPARVEVTNPNIAAHLENYKGLLNVEQENLLKNGTKRFFYVMPKFDADLTSPRRKELSPKEIERIKQQIQSAVEALHAKEFVHQDIQLRNVLYRRNENGIIECTLADYGKVKQPLKDSFQYKKELDLKALKKLSEQLDTLQASQLVLFDFNRAKTIKKQVKNRDQRDSLRPTRAYKSQ